LDKSEFSNGAVGAKLKPRRVSQLEARPAINDALHPSYPVEIQASVAKFRIEHPDESKVAFIMMRFEQTGLHEKVLKGIKSALEPHGIMGLRADDKQYHDDLFDNILTYIFGCGLGIAVLGKRSAEPYPRGAANLRLTVLMSAPGIG
jgi:hypothetical protein